MEEKTKKTIFFIGSIFVAVIFVTSYAAFSNNGSGASASTTTIGAANTVYVFGTANGIIVNYSYSAYVTVANKSQATSINATLGALEANGTVSNFVLLNSTTYQAILSTINTYQFYLYLSQSLNDSNVPVEGYAYVQLPATISMHYSGSVAPVSISFPTKNYSVFLQRAVPISTTVPIKVEALITTAGNIYNNNIRLTEG